MKGFYLSCSPCSLSYFSWSYLFQNLGRYLWQVIFLCLMLFLLSACDGGGDGSGDDSNGNGQEPVTGDDSEQLTLFTTAEVVSQNMESIEAREGGSITHEGAVLTVPANALSQDADITLASTSLPSQSMDNGNFVLAGRSVISPTGYVITSNQQVSLNGPLTLRIPINPNLISSQSTVDDIEISTDTSGHLIGQGLPTLVDLEQGYVEFEITSKILYEDANNTLFGPPQGYMIPVVLLVIGGAVETLNPIVVTVKTALNSASNELTSEHFQLYYSDSISQTDASQLINDLETGYDLFVDQMGFNWPNWFNGDDRYTFVVGDISSYVDRIKTLITGAGKVEVPPGYTLPGSALFEGGSFIDVFREQDQRRVTIVHELFHSLQYGSVAKNIGGNLAKKTFNPRALWLFEGSATVLAGRVIIGQGTNPARDSDIDFRLPENKSLHSFADGVLPNDIAQDYFFFLERYLNRFDFYRPAFENLDFGISPIADTERASRALDTVLKDITGDANGLEDTWAAFVRDYVIENPNLYATATIANFNHQLILDRSGATGTLTPEMPPLSYSRVRFAVPGYEKDSNGDVLPDQSSDLELTYTVDAGLGFGMLLLDFADQLTSEATIHELGTALSTEERTYRVTDIRAEQTQFFHMLVTNNSMLDSDDLTLIVNAKLAESERPSLDSFFTFLNFDGTTGPSLEKPTADPADADIQLTGSNDFPVITWDRASTSLAVLDITSQLNNSTGVPDLVYCIRSLDDEETFEEIPFSSPIAYGDYSVENTEPCSGAISPSPALISGRNYQIVVDDAFGEAAASILFSLE